MAVPDWMMEAGLAPTGEVEIPVSVRPELGVAIVGMVYAIEAMIDPRRSDEEIKAADREVTRLRKIIEGAGLDVGGLYTRRRDGVVTWRVQFRRSEG